MTGANRRRHLGGLALGVVGALLCARAVGQPERGVVEESPQDIGALLTATVELRQQLAIEAAKSARAAQAFGASLVAADRRELQSACSALVDSPSDAAARQRLALMMSRYKDNNAEAIVRFCLDPEITFLQEQLLVSHQSLQTLQTLERAPASDISQTRGAELASAMRRQQQTFTSISNVMKTKHDTAKNSISNVR